MKEGKYFEMDFKVYLRRFTSLFLCCLLVFCSLPVQVYATDPVTAASLVITGGELAGAGLSGEAALSLAGPVGAVVGLTLGALGVNAYVSKAAQEAGVSRSRFVADKLIIWGAQAGYTAEQLYSRIASGISVAADGTIQLANDAAKTIYQFGNWLFSQEGEVVPSISSGTMETMTIGNYNVKCFSDTLVTGNYGGETSYIVTHGGPVFFRYATQDGLNFAPFTFTQGTTLTRYFVSSNGSIEQTHYTFGYSLQNKNGLKIYHTGGSTYTALSANILSSDYFLPYSFINDFLNSTMTPEFSSSSVTTDAVFTGTPESWAENKDVLNPSAEDTPVVLNPDLLNPIIDSLADGQQATMSIIDYLQALQDAWDHALDDVQTAIGKITDTLTGIQEQIAVPQDAVDNPTVTNPSVTPDTIPILNPSDVDPGTAITGLSFDLTNIFPFCIPFDIYAALNLLDAEPVAPSYHFHLEWPYNIVIDFTLDLSPFNQVAAVARTMEILLFIIGLAVMTRSMFIRG